MNILLSGDSWGVGEWGNKKDRYAPTHYSYKRFFKKAGHNLVNESRGGSSNKESTFRLRRQVMQNKFDFVFWIQSNPLRDLDYSKFSEDHKTFDDIINSKKKLLNISYKFLNDLNIPIYCLGGCSKLDIEIIQQYSNLIPFIPSITEFLLDDYCHPELWLDDWHQYIDEKQFDLKSLDNIIECGKTQDQLHQVEKYRKYFWPDGAHPNRHGHKLIFNYMCQQLNI